MEREDQQSVTGAGTGGCVAMLWVVVTHLNSLV